MDWASVGTTTVIISTFIGALWTVFLYLGKQFKELRVLAYSLNEQLKGMILNKLEYHERHDDQRFMSLSNDIWDIRLRNAARDGLPTPPERKQVSFDQEAHHRSTGA